jgi:hypothetical protein
MGEELGNAEFFSIILCDTCNDHHHFVVELFVIAWIFWVNDYFAHNTVECVLVCFEHKESQLHSSPLSLFSKIKPCVSVTLYTENLV